METVFGKTGVIYFIKCFYESDLCHPFSHYGLCALLHFPGIGKKAWSSAASHFC